MSPEKARTRPIQMIPVPGWRIEEDPTGSCGLIAVRLSILSNYQLEYGARQEIECADMGELWILIDAQTRLAERLASAEAVHNTHRDARVARVRSRAGGSPEEDKNTLGTAARPLT